MLWVFAEGVMIGFAVAAPIGPVGLLCIRRSLNRGKLAGLFTGLGAAVADGTYGLVAGFGVASVSALLISYRLWLELFGGAALCIMGYGILKSPLRKPRRTVEGVGSLGQAFASTLLLTLANPVTILSFIAVFASLGLDRAARGYFGVPILGAGVFCGSMAWWSILSSTVSSAGTRISLRVLGVINFLSGFVLLGFGLTGLYAALVGL